MEHFINQIQVGTNQNLVIRTCTVHKLLEADGATSSFTLQIDDTQQVAVANAYIGSCNTDACNRADNRSPNHHLPLLFSILFLLFFLFVFILN